MYAVLRGWVPSIAWLGSLVIPIAPAVAQNSAIQIAPLQVDPKLNAMLPENIRNTGVLRLATDAHYPPCESVAEDNRTMVGWEPDFWNALGQVMGVKVEPESIAFAGLIPGVASGRYDIAMECIADNPDREKQVMFVDVIFARSAAFTLESNTEITNDPLSFCGRRTATQQGTNFVESVEQIMSLYCEKNGKSKIDNSIFPSVDATLLALYAGRVDFVLNNAMSVSELKKKAPKPIKVIDVPQLPKRYVGIVINKDNKDLAEALLAGTKALHTTGAYDQIIAKWDLQLLKLPEPGINLVTRKAPG
jgi:polar amino acid transport system substrate-binding protein